MSFEDMLAKWEAEHGVNYVDVSEGRDEEPDDPQEKQQRKARLKRMKPQRTLDLHGMTTDQASEQVFEFLSTSVAEGLEKVLLVHGKGYHSDNGVPVLKNVAYECLERSPYAGEHGIPDRTLGGSGAVWVILKSPKEQ
ncbi:MAG: Smr/MutS family protein [Spirochaetota bacterium]